VKLKEELRALVVTDVRAPNFISSDRFKIPSETLTFILYKTIKLSSTTSPQ
jgi:hypothetical protein